MLKRVEKADLLTSVVMVDQSPIGRTPRSNPVTYIKAFDIIRDFLRQRPKPIAAATHRGIFVSTFPAAAAKLPGRWHGYRRDAVPRGRRTGLRRVQRDAIQAEHSGYSLQGVEHTRSAANDGPRGDFLFRGTPKLAQRLKVLQDVGFGYLRLGQSATTLSGGEAQRVKLAGHLAQASCQGTLFLFDEPTTGLHFDDIAKLLDSFERLIQNGGSILLIEHNLDLIQAADWVIDLGPEGGDGGGRIVAEGTPELVATVQESYTGRFLREALKSRAIA